MATSEKANPRGADFLSGREPCYAVYRTADGRHMAVGALEKKFWDRVCEVLERPDLKGGHWEVRSCDAASTKKEVAAIFASRTLAYWVEKFASEDCCVTPVLRLEESVVDAQLNARRMVVEDHGAAQFAPPFKMSDFEFEIDKEAPGAGAHTDEILGQVGLSRGDIEVLRAAKVI